MAALAEQAAGLLGARIAGSPGAVLASGVDGMVIAASTGFWGLPTVDACRCLLLLLSAAGLMFGLPLSC